MSNIENLKQREFISTIRISTIVECEENPFEIEEIIEEFREHLKEILYKNLDFGNFTDPEIEITSYKI